MPAEEGNFWDSWFNDFEEYEDELHPIGLMDLKAKRLSEIFGQVNDGITADEFWRNFSIGAGSFGLNWKSYEPIADDPFEVKANIITYQELRFIIEVK